MAGVVHILPYFICIGHEKAMSVSQRSIIFRSG